LPCAMKYKLPTSTAMASITATVARRP